MTDELTGMQIMVVDDTPDNLRLLTRILKDKGYKVRPVPNGKLALAAIKVSAPDLILLDINMPYIDGYEVCNRLKKDDLTKEIPVIFLSAMNETVDKVKAFESGGVDYITKPFQIEEVLARVKTHLKLFSLQRQMEETNKNLERIVKKRTDEILKLRVLKHRIELELKIANNIQKSILPQNLIDPERTIAVYAENKPARRVGGDFYDFFPIDKGKVFFCIGDVSGKGIAAAMFMAIVKTLIKVEAKQLKSLLDVVITVNNFLINENETCMFASVFCGIIDTVKGVVEYCNAGHTAPVLKKANQDYEFLPIHKDTVIGILPAAKGDYYIGEFEFEQGARLFLYSDGVTEALNKNKEEYTEDRLLKALNRTNSIEISNVLDILKNDLLTHMGDEEQADDITAMILENSIR